MIKKYLLLSLLFSASLYAGGEDLSSDTEFNQDLDSIYENSNSSQDRDIQDTPKPNPIRYPLSLQAQCLAKIAANKNIVNFNLDKLKDFPHIQEQLLLATSSEADLDKDDNSEKAFKHKALTELILAAVPYDKDRDFSLEQLFIGAVATGSKEVIQLFIDRGFSVKSKDYCRWTPLAMAADSNQVEIAELLLNHGADDMHKAAREAIGSGHIDIVKLFIAHGLDLKSINGDWTPMYTAAGNGDKDKAIKMLQFLLDSGLDINQEDSDGSTALLNAVHDHKEQYRVVQFLLEHGANPNAKSYRRTALHNAASYNDTKTALLLLDYGAQASPNPEDRDQTPLCFAARCGNNELIQRLLATGADQELANDNHEALTDAARRGHTETIKLLLAARAHVTPIEGTYYLKKPLREAACWSNSLNTLELLFSKGAQLDSKKDGLPAIQIALGKNRLAIAAFLLKRIHLESLERYELKGILTKALEKNSLKITALICHKMNADDLARFSFPECFYKDTRYRQLRLFIKHVLYRGFGFAVKEYKARLARNRARLTRILQASGKFFDFNILNSIVELSLPDELEEFKVAPDLVTVATPT